MKRDVKLLAQRADLQAIGPFLARNGRRAAALELPGRDSPEYAAALGIPPLPGMRSASKRDRDLFVKRLTHWAQAESAALSRIEEERHVESRSESEDDGNEDARDDGTE